MKNQISIAGTILAVTGIGARGPKSVIPAKQAVSKRPRKRESRESGNPGEVERGQYAAVAPLHHPWIPAFAGMTEGACQKLAFDTAWKAGIRGAGIA